MKRFHARNEVVKALKAKGLYVGWADNEMSIPVCSCVPSLIPSRSTWTDDLITATTASPGTLSSRS